MSISTNSLQNLVNLATRSPPTEFFARDLDDLTQDAKDAGNDLLQNIKNNTADALDDATGDAKNAADAVLSGKNLTAKNLGLADYYRVSLWSYCAYTDGKRNCSKAKMDWAKADFDAPLVIDGTAANVTFPKDVRTALNTFAKVSKWTQVVYIIAVVCGAIELVFGLFAICSRIGSCCTLIVSSIATTAIIVASILATVQSSVVVGAVKSTAGSYNVKASINTSFLSVTWLAVAFSLGAGLFWAFTMCCCAADHKSKNKGSKGFGGFGKNRGFGGPDAEKLIPSGGTGYQRVGDDHGDHGYPSQHGVPLNNVRPQHGGAYEPYAHAAV